MPSCAVYSCRNHVRKTKGTKIRYFRFPKTDMDMAQAWINSCGRNNINIQNARVCSIHFTKDSYEIPLRQRLLNYITTNSRHLKPTAIPTENLPETAMNRRRPLSIEYETEQKQPDDDINDTSLLSIKLEIIDDQTENATFKKYIEEPGTLKQEVEVAVDENELY